MPEVVWVTAPRVVAAVQDEVAALQLVPVGESLPRETARGDGKDPVSLLKAEFSPCVRSENRSDCPAGIWRQTT